MSNTALDKSIEIAKETIEKQRKEVLATEKVLTRGWVTNGSYPICDNKSINIQTCNMNNVVVIMRHLLLNESFHKAALKELKLKVTPFEVDGYTVKDWKTDLELRIAKITIKEKKEKLDILEKKLKNVMSEDQKRAAAFSEIMSELNGLDGTDEVEKED